MEATDHTRKLEQLLNYLFGNPRYLLEALTVAGTEGEGYQGNRWLEYHQVSLEIVDVGLS
ncbi:hypothetical protein BDW62DRAFT_16999 [Aspergillus aurantiobrunneus]|jgi:hypothetical protein